MCMPNRSKLLSLTVGVVLEKDKASDAVKRKPSKRLDKAKKDAAKARKEKERKDEEVFYSSTDQLGTVDTPSASPPSIILIGNPKSEHCRNSHPGRQPSHASHPCKRCCWPKPLSPRLILPLPIAAPLHAHCVKLCFVAGESEGREGCRRGQEKARDREEAACRARGLGERARDGLQQHDGGRGPGAADKQERSHRRPFRGAGSLGGACY